MTSLLRCVYSDITVRARAAAAAGGGGWGWRATGTRNLLWVERTASGARKCRLRVARDGQVSLSPWPWPRLLISWLLMLTVVTWCATGGWSLRRMWRREVNAGQSLTLPRSHCIRSSRFARASLLASSSSIWMHRQCVKSQVSLHVLSAALSYCNSATANVR